jgi:hypothetical protein
MKKFSKYIFALAALALASTACVKEAEYEKGPQDVEGCYGVYFPTQEVLGSNTIDPTAPTSLTLVVARQVSEKAITVPISVKGDTDVINIGEAVFEDGQSETEVTIDFSTAEVGTTYKVELSIEGDEFASKYNDNATHAWFSVLIDTFECIGTGFLRDDLITALYSAPNAEYEVEIYEYGSTPGKYYLKNAYTSKYPYNEEGDYVTEDKYFVVDASNPNKVSVPYQKLGMDWGSGDFYVTSFTDEVFNIDPSQALYGKLVDKIITFPEKSIMVSMEQKLPSFYYGNGSGLFRICLPGAVPVDYSFYVETDYSVEGVTPLSFELGVDIETVKYVVAAGKIGLSAVNELLAGIKDGTAENVQTLTGDQLTLDEENAVKYATVGLTCPQTGEYTVVAVGFDAEGTAQASETIVFDYVAASDDSYAVNYTVEVSDTPARYAEQYNAMNSFEFLIYGGNQLTDLKLGVYATADVDKYGLDAVVADLRTGDSVSAETLALVNSLVGYNDLITGLKDDTSYTLVVWGTNGKQTKVFTEIYVTEPNPEVFKSLGMCSYTDDIVCTTFGLSTVTYEVEIQESVDNPGKYRLVNPYGEIYPYNEPGDWDADNTYYLTIDATDPDYVNLVQSDLGIDWGYGPMTALSFADYLIDAGEATKEQMKAAGYYGKLVDGVITFNVNTLGLAMGGKLYYANMLGEFKVVLPGASTDTPVEECTETTAVKKSANLTATPFACYMSKGRIANLDIQPEVRTVNCVVSELPVASHQSNKRTAELKAFELR